MSSRHFVSAILLSFVSFFSFAFVSVVSAQSSAQKFAGSTPLQWSVRYANSETTRVAASNEYGMPIGKWNYANFLYLRSLLYLDARLAEKSPRYTAFVQQTVDSFLSADGKTIAKFKPEEYSIDDIAPGVTVEYLYRLAKSDRYRTTIQILRDQLDKHPRISEGGFWHKKRYPHQMWLDGLYMGSPFYAEYTSTFASADKRAAAYDDIALQIRLVDKYTYDQKTGLHYHGWDESREQNWANKTTGQSPNFWSRAIGWYAMAMVDVLDFLPNETAADQARRAEVISILKRLTDGIIKYQDPATGLWWQVTDQGNRKGNYLEATASAMFAYTMAKAINKGYLERLTYQPAALKAYAGIIENFIRVNANGSIDLTRCCQVAGLGYGRDGSYEYYLSEPIIDNDPKGSGPFVLAGIEFDQLLGIHESVKTLPASPTFKITNPASNAPASAKAPAN